MYISIYIYMHIEIRVYRSPSSSQGWIACGAHVTRAVSQDASKGVRDSGLGFRDLIACGAHVTSALSVKTPSSEVGIRVQIYP